MAVSMPAGDARPHLMFVCTGNAARSVMATVMFRDRCDTYRISGAGTFVVEGHPMSIRTRRALERHGLIDHTHRSRQLWLSEASDAEVVIVMAPEHVQWVRANLPQLSARTVTIKRLVRDLPKNKAATLPEAIASMRLDEVETEPWEEVVDPAAGDQPIFDACADELDVLIDELVAQLQHYQ